jgi:hypothetical protein
MGWQCAIVSIAYLAGTIIQGLRDRHDGALPAHSAQPTYKINIISFLDRQEVGIGVNFIGWLCAMGWQCAIVSIAYLAGTIIQGLIVLPTYKINIISFLDRQEVGIGELAGDVAEEFLAARTQLHHRQVLLSPLPAYPRS